MLIFIILGLVSFIVGPPVLGYGTTEETAEYRTLGTYQETFLAGDNNAVYNVTGVVAKALKVTIAYDSGVVQMFVQIYDPSGMRAVADMDPKDIQSVYMKCQSTDNYTVWIFRYSGSSGEVNFTMTIEFIDPPQTTLPMEMQGVLLIITLCGVAVVMKILYSKKPEGA